MSSYHKTTNHTLFFLIVFVLLTFYYSLPLNATIRYVSKTGSNTPPYTTWETAADSIQKCINISFFGDTIYVANGVYQEQVVMIPGLALIGSGTDSCIVDSRSLVSAWDDKAIEITDSCLLRGFKIIVSNNFEYGMGVAGPATPNTLVTQNRITNSRWGIFLEFYSTINDATVYKNIVDEVRYGIQLFNSNSLVRNNIVITSPNQYETEGIYIAGFTEEYTPLIDSNYIVDKHWGIYQQLGANPTIKNNTIIKRGGDGIHIGVGRANIFNNLIIAESGYDGIYGNGTIKKVINNYVTGNFYSFGISHSSPSDIIKNNVVTNCSGGISVWNNQNLTIKYNNVWNNDVNYSGFTPDSTNLSVNPMIVNDDTTQGELDFRLQMYSPLIDAGDPTILDRDGSRSDIGLYGGPYGWTYTYQDLSPRPPHNVTAAIEEGLVKLTWNKNTEADFSHYRIYRDTVTIVIYDSTKMIAETPDTFYYDQLPPENHETRFYYVITAFDNQGNQSYPSEEINVLVTGLGEHPPKGYDGYRLLANYPNPFNPSTKIPYRLKEAGYVKLYVYDLKGELVKVLVNQWQEKGFYEVEFHPTLEEKGKVTQLEIPMGKRYNQMSSGIYLYVIQVYDGRNIPVFSDAEKMILLK